MLTQVSSYGQPLDSEIENIHRWYNRDPRTTITAVSSTDSLSESEAGLVECDTSSGVVTTTLPTAAGNLGLTYTLKLVTAGNNWVIEGYDAETIDGAANHTLSAVNQCLVIRSDNTNWQIISKYTP